mmetsp:Transcript_55958/g.173505  ORF Transcript_55958/g.173505 Transcript_55958/m.173505 type:complete len:404 (-) Transcript_55958:465-1676(-)
MEEEQAEALERQGGLVVAFALGQAMHDAAQGLHLGPRRAHNDLEVLVLLASFNLGDGRPQPDEELAPPLHALSEALAVGQVRNAQAEGVRACDHAQVVIRGVHRHDREWLVVVRGGSRGARGVRGAGANRRVLPDPRLVGAGAGWRLVAPGLLLVVDVLAQLCGLVAAPLRLPKIAEPEQEAGLAIRAAEPEEEELEVKDVPAAVPHAHVHRLDRAVWRGSLELRQEQLSVLLMRDQVWEHAALQGLVGRPEKKAGKVPGRLYDGTLMVELHHHVTENPEERGGGGEHLVGGLLLEGLAEARLQGELKHVAAKREDAEGGQLQDDHGLQVDGELRTVNEQGAGGCDHRQEIQDGDNEQRPSDHVKEYHVQVEERERNDHRVGAATPRRSKHRSDQNHGDVKPV